MGDKYTIKQGISQYPSFHYKELESIDINSISDDITINSLNLLKQQFETLTNELKILFDSNINNFNIQSKIYKRNTLDYLILSQLSLLLCEIILFKLKQKDETLKNFNYDKNKTINEIKSKYENNLDFIIIFKRVEGLLDKFEKIYESKHNYAIIYLYIIFNYIICYIKEILNQLKLFKDIKISINLNYSIEQEIILIDLIFMLEKLDSICIFISSGYFVDKNDILNQKQDSDDWKNINRIGYQVVSSRENEIQKVFKEQNLKSELLIDTLLNSYNENSFKVINAFYFLYKYRQYGKDQKLMLYEGRKQQLIQNKIVTKEIMDIVLWPTFKKIGERGYQKIKFRKKLYIKKEYPDITLDGIQKLLKLMGNETIDVSNIKQEIIYKNQNDIINNKCIKKGELYINKPSKETKKYFVSITLLNSSYINLPEERNTLKYSIMNGIFGYDKPNINQDALMIFIHGGGFVGMSTHFHESFLRDWANQLNIPIIGINYGLSPKHKYPYALNDCYQAYRWIVNHCEEILGIKPKKLIFAGDSSGGGLVLSIIFLLIAKNEFEGEKIRLPDLLVLLYPCCNTSANIMGSSFLLSIKDFLLSDKFLLYVNESYRDIYPNDDDPFLNPVKAKECILKKLPKSLWQFGTCDPLRDDEVRLLAKISKIKEVDIKAYEFLEYNHGYIGGEKIEFIVNTPTKIIFEEIRDLLNS